jgi:hypothetical protein
LSSVTSLSVPAGALRTAHANACTFSTPHFISHCPLLI